MMKTRILPALIFLALCFSMSGCKGTAPSDKDVDRSLRTAVFQMKALGQLYYDSDVFPRSWDEQTGSYNEFTYRDWTCGFYPGCLWLCHELTGDGECRDLAEHFTAKVKDVPFMTHTHDLGFMVLCSYGLQYAIEGDDVSREAVLQAARSLASRFNPGIGLIRSWDFGKWHYPVIIDNMMNLELLFKASELTGDPVYRDIAVSHADKTIANHFREDNSSWHVVSYNDDGTVEMKTTYQGYSDDSRWARGQAWGLYGYTVCYRFTSDPAYLDQAKKIASLIMDLPTMPDDGIPYWDYDAPGIPDEPRDASAAAITASALLELQGMVEEPLAGEYVRYAGKILSSLCSPAYLAAPGTNGSFILKHSTGAAPIGSEVDDAINYDVYYFIEALKRLINLRNP